MKTPSYNDWVLRQANQAFLDGNEGLANLIVRLYLDEFPSTYKPKEPPSHEIQRARQSVKDSFKNVSP